MGATVSKSKEEDPRAIVDSISSHDGSSSAVTWRSSKGSKNKKKLQVEQVFASAFVARERTRGFEKISSASGESCITVKRSQSFSAVDNNDGMDDAETYNANAQDAAATKIQAIKRGQDGKKEFATHKMSLAQQEAEANYNRARRFEKNLYKDEYAAKKKENVKYKRELQNAREQATTEAAVSLTLRLRKIQRMWRDKIAREKAKRQETSCCGLRKKNKVVPLMEQKRQQEADNRKVQDLRASKAADEITAKWKKDQKNLKDVRTGGKNVSSKWN